jgi:AcrR family transcriptional regulator
MISEGLFHNSARRAMISRVRTRGRASGRPARAVGIPPGTRPGPGRPALDHGALRDAIREAALDLFAERGIANVAITEVLQRAGVSAGSFYRLYEDKEAVLAELVDLGREDADALIERRRAEEEAPLTDPLARLATYARILVEAVDIFDPWTARLRRIVAHGGSETLRALTEESDRRMIEGTLPILRAAQDAGVLRPLDIEATAPLIMAIIKEASMRGTPPADEVAELVVRAVRR